MYKGIYSYPFYKLVSDMYSNSPNNARKHLILEPFSCVIRVILLQYKERGTKISILDNGISYNPPSVAQGFMRAWYGDNREDLHNLCSPILYFKKWFPKHIPIYHNLHDECVQGLYVLREAYDKKSTIYHTLTHYINILQNGQEDMSGTSEEPGNDSDSDADSDSIAIPPDSKENPLIEHLKNIWSTDEITLITYLLTLIKDNHTSETVYLHNLEDILRSKELYVNSFIKEITTSY